MTSTSCCGFRPRWTLLVVCSAGLVLGALVAGKVRPSRADLTAPNANDRQVTVSVTSLLKSDHLTGHALDDEISQRCLAAFIKALDPLKMYFNQADIDEFTAQKTKLDDLFKKGNIEFAYAVFQKYLHRVDQRVEFVDEILQMDHNFTEDEEMVTDPDHAKYAADDDEARDLWRKRIKYDLLVLKAEALDAEEKRAKDPTAVIKPVEDPAEKLGRKYRSIAKRMRQTDHDELLEMYLTSLTTSYDPHTTYMSPSSQENFDIIMRLNLDGIGASLQFQDGYTVVHKVIPGGAADKDGRLKPEDRIVGVGQGESGDLVDVVDLKLSDVVQLIRGKSGSKVRLQVVPTGQTDRLVYDITRAKIELTDSEARSQIIKQDFNGRTWRIGVIDLPSFYLDMEADRRGLPDFKSTTRDVEQLLQDFRNNNVDAVVLDLRRNGGGSLKEAISLTGLFIDEGPIVQVKDKESRIEHYDDAVRGTAWDGPLVVLTSKFSASASEIFAGAIQDYKRGIIVGDKSTHGKGTVQSLVDLGGRLFRIGNPPKLGALKITMQQFYRPSGDSTQNRGVLADIELPSITTHLDVGETDLEYALEFDQVDALPYHALDLVDKTVVDRLKNLSDERLRDSADFQRVVRNVKRYLEQKNRAAVTLNEEKFMAERAELNAEQEEEREFQALEEAQKEVFDIKDFYNQEAVSITLDYLQLKKLARAD